MTTKPTREEVGEAIRWADSRTGILKPSRLPKILAAALREAGAKLAKRDEDLREARTVLEAVASDCMLEHDGTLCCLEEAGADTAKEVLVRIKSVMEGG